MAMLGCGLVNYQQINHLDADGADCRDVCFMLKFFLWEGDKVPKQSCSTQPGKLIIVKSELSSVAEWRAIGRSIV